MAEKIGVFIPTFRRPDLLRASVLQWIVQSRQPDLICVHQNGGDPSYEWAVADLKDLANIHWITSDACRPNEWYSRPLRYLLDQGCTHFFWSDHDDIYLRNHIRVRLSELDQTDCALSNRVAILYVRDKEYFFEPVTHFHSHPAGGMSSSMAFTRPFAEALYGDWQNNLHFDYADKVVSEITAKRFDLEQTDKQTTIYVSHAGTQTSSDWLDLKLPISSDHENRDSNGDKAIGT